MDLQGPDAARPWYEKHQLTYPTLVDASNRLGRTIGFRVVPNEFYIDELGVFHDRIEPGQLPELLAEPMQTPPPDLKRKLQYAAPRPGRVELDHRLQSTDDFPTLVAAGKLAYRQHRTRDAVQLLTRACAADRTSAEAWTTLAVAHLAAGDKPAAAAALRNALQRDPGNWLIHKQIWAIEHPHRFYDGNVDFQWQRRQLQKETDEK